MTIRVGIRIQIKFRAFGKTLGRADQSLEVDYDGKNLFLKTIPGPPEGVMLEVFNDRGVTVHLWPLMF